MDIIFDLGGVIFRWRPNEIIAGVFADPSQRSLVRREVLEHPDWQGLDRGTLTYTEAAARAAERTGLQAAAISRFLERVPAALVPVPQMVKLLYRLRAVGHRLYCLSNMHRPAIDHLEASHDLWPVFSGMVISCRIHLIKPERAIYEHLLGTHGLSAGSAIFIDDSPVNLEPAAALGINPILFESKDQCEKRLRGLGCL